MVLAPGNRTDLLVRPVRDGRYTLVADPYDRGSIGMMGGGPPTSGPVTLATLEASGPAATPPPLPVTLPGPAPRPPRKAGWPVSVGSPSP